MTYATRQDLIDRFGAGEIESLDAGVPSDPADDDSPREYPRIETALADARFEMDAHLGVRYELPLDATTAASELLERICCAIARYLCYDDVAPDEVKDRAKHARMMLKSLAAAEMVLPGMNGKADARLAEPEFGERIGPDPVMTNEALRGL